MNDKSIASSWRSIEFREELEAGTQDLLPGSPAGIVEISDDVLQALAAAGDCDPNYACCMEDGKEKEKEDPDRLIEDEREETFKASAKGHINVDGKIIDAGGEGSISYERKSHYRRAGDPPK